MKNDSYSIGEFIKEHRIKSGFAKQTNLSTVSGLPAATISRIENKVHKPTPDTIQLLAMHLKTTSYKELMIVAGHYNEDLNLNNVDEVGEESVILKNFDEITDKDLINMFNSKINKKLTDKQAKYFVRHFRRIFDELDDIY